MESSIFPPFVLRDSATDSTRELLLKNTLGTHGSKYKQLDTEKRISQLDSPLFLSLERNGKTKGNCTFCRRNRNWYIRFFAFDALFQGKGNTRSKSTNSGFKKRLNAFFSQKLTENVDLFYAYIDPKNVKSVWMSENLGFKKVGDLQTQTFSRSKPTKKLQLEKWEKVDLISRFMEEKFGDRAHFVQHHVASHQVYVARNDQGEICAFGRFHEVNWEIERLPGKAGKLLVKLLPFLPVLRKIIRPSQHQFLVLDSFWVKDNKAHLAQHFLESALHIQQQHLIFWWVDEREELYQALSKSLSWGIFQKVMGENKVNIVEHSNSARTDAKPFYVFGLDLV